MQTVVHGERVSPHYLVHAGTAEPLRVSPPEAVAYLLELKNLVMKQHLLRSSRRNVSPVELIDGPFLMCHEHLTGTLVERREIAQTPSRANGVLHDPPEAFDRIEMVATMGW